VQQTAADTVILYGLWQTFPYWIMEGLLVIRPQAAENLQIGLSMFGF
jgi:hypothetical protein